jgi:hypothetical protein
VPQLRQYTIVVGRVGEAPALMESMDRPFRLRTGVDRLEFDVRMESWLPTDTIRRAGFGHVIVGRHHALTIERGISFLAAGAAGGTAYSSGLFASIPQYALGGSGGRQ